MDKPKVSFGFSKINKKPQLLKQPVKKEEKQVELIKCLEGKEILLVEEKREAPALVIPMPESTKTSSALASLMKRRAVLLGEEEQELTSAAEKTEEANNTSENGAKSIEERAANELLAEVLKNGSDSGNNLKLVLPVLKADELPLDGAKESTRSDYEDIPVEQFGFAMLRGMGWVDPPKKKSTVIDDQPVLRPKGMGLGADKALKPKPLLVAPEANEKLEIKKQAYIRILAGKFKDAYGQIEGFDDEHSRVIVKMAIGGQRETFNEFLCQPVAKKEYIEYGKCINSVKYEEYKRYENEYGQIIRNIPPKEEKYSVKEEKYKRSDLDGKKYFRADKEDKYYVKKEERRRSRSRNRSRSRSRDYKEKHKKSHKSKKEHKKKKSHRRDSPY